MPVEPTFRHPTAEDGAAVYELVRDVGGLDLNTPYAYLLMTRLFARSCVVAEVDGEFAGTVVGLRPPEEPDALFVWQIGVHPRHRGIGLGTRMLRWLTDASRPVHLTATVTPTNTASDRLFRGFARHLEVPCEVTTWAREEDFPEEGHEREDLYRIGPLRTS